MPVYSVTTLLVRQLPNTKMGKTKKRAKDGGAKSAQKEVQKEVQKEAQMAIDTKKNKEQTESRKGRVFFGINTEKRRLHYLHFDFILLQTKSIFPC